MPDPGDPFAPLDPYDPMLGAPVPAPPLPFGVDPDALALPLPPALPPEPAPATPLDAQVQPGLGLPAGALDAALPPPTPVEPLPFADDLAGPPPLDRYADYPPPPPLGLPEWSPDLAPPVDVAAPAGAAAPPELGDDQSWLHEHAPQAFPAPGPRQLFDVTAESPFAGLTDEQAFAEAGRRTPEELLKLEAAQKLRKATAFELRQHAIDEEQLRQIKENAEVRRIADEKTRAEEDHINADARALGQAHLDRHRWFRDASAVQKIGAIVGTLVGGLMSKPGEPNAGVKFLTDIIDNDIADQKYDLENKRADLQFRSGAVAREYARTGDLYRSTEAVRLATYNALLGQLQTDQQNFDPRGTMFIEYGKQIQAWRAHMSAAQETQRVARRNEHEKDARLALDAQKVIDERLAHQQTTQLGYAQLKSAAADRKEARDARAADKDAERADKAAERRRQFAIGGMPVVQVGPDSKPVIGPDGKPVIKYDDLRNADNTVWEAESPEATKELRQKKTAAEESISIIDEIRAIRGRVGGESKLLNSNESQRLKVLQARSRVITKQGTQGMSSDEDGKLLSEAAGTGDADSWRDQDAALLEARARTESELNRALSNAKYSGPRIHFPEPRPAADTPQDAADKELLRAPSTSLSDEFKAELARRTESLSPEERRAFGPNLSEGTAQGMSQQQRAVLEAVQRTYDPGASSDQQRQIAALGVAAEGTSPAALEAAARLQKVATSADTGRLRELARQALQGAQDRLAASELAATPGAPAVFEPERAGARETVPPPRGR